MTKNDLIYQPHFTQWLLEKLERTTGSSQDALTAMYRAELEETQPPPPLTTYQVETLEGVKWVKPGKWLVKPRF